MRKKSYYLVVFTFVIGVVTTVRAQEKIENKDNQKMELSSNVQKSNDRLGLQKEQQVPFREIIKRYAILTRDVRKSSLSKEEKISKMKELDLQREAEIKNILSVEQFKIFQEIRDEKKSQFVDMRKK